MSELERQTESYLIDTIYKLGGMCLKFGVPGVRGYPDRLCRLPGAADGFFVELKRPKGGRLSKLQPIRHAELRAIGYRVYVCKDREEIDAVLTTELERCKSA